ncbi:MAG: Extracellular solute-binding protein family 5 [Candidatus Gallionella acididurans]|uniref:Extracellular solute-binding protein family 5 n=1 Tax=Candidatus Gallionella acididurans TaxID=1796491 RepID=A0A139BUI7_9PROT|nr:MAG: Extracellular solute-binding protein family 5 [Candidatus Gallionella acididurans]
MWVLLLSACDGGLWNDPYPASDNGKSIFYTAFTERPKHLDPAQAYSENEYEFLAQIYAPPLQYHYLKRPYELVPLAASAMPTVHYLDKNRRPLPDTAPASKVAYSVYEIHIKPGMRYQPHPAFARDAQGRLEYDHLTAHDLSGIHALGDFPRSGTRTVTAADYAYQIKRLAHPLLQLPIFGVMSEYIVGLKDYAATLQQAVKKNPGAFLDLNKYPLPGVQVVDDLTYRIEIIGKYPQFAYWLAMPFFAPMPEEAERFYAQDGMRERNLILDWWPVGSGPYYLSENNPNRRMVMTRNPYYDSETYPAEGDADDAAAGLLADAGKPLPMIDQIVFTLEKETIPYWNKFLQGYYDASGISSDSFDQAVQMNVGGEATVTDAMKAQGIRLSTSVATSTMYTGFNWLDPVVGGGCTSSTSAPSPQPSPEGRGGKRNDSSCDPERARKLRQAIAIAVDFEEFISIFANGRGIAAQSPIPPGIFGYRDGEAGINHYVYDWVDGAPRRKSVETAKRLLAEAGYPDGVDAQTHQPLVINLDTTASGAGDKSRLDWLRKQFAKINVQLVARSTDYNRFQDKVRKGDTQMFYYGWNADYPDPENFLFLLSSAQAKVSKGGENAANYSNPEYDRLFQQMKNMENSPARQAIIDRMLEILRRDSPWLWGYHPKNYVLQQSWLSNVKANVMANNKLKYWRVDAGRRDVLRRAWNQPVLWPLWMGAGAVLLFGVWLWRMLRLREEAK